MTLSISPSAARASLSTSRMMVFFTAVVAIQGIHVVEHLIQLAQVYLFGVSEDRAFGLLGYVFAIQGTEEWLHLVFNATYLASLYALGFVIWRAGLLSRISYSTVVIFVALALGLETWHVVEHSVIIANVLANDGCPCPGIGDRALGVSDTVLHFAYNAVAYASTVAMYLGVRRLMPATRRPA